MTGTIKQKNDKGYGFILGEKQDYFFHTSQCITHFDHLSPGDKVEFEIEESPKGPRAKDVRLV